MTKKYTQKQEEMSWAEKQQVYEPFEQVGQWWGCCGLCIIPISQMGFDPVTLEVLHDC